VRYSLLIGRLEVCLQRKLSRFRASPYALLLGPLLLSFCVKVWLINSRGLWLDETYSAFVAKLPFFQLLRFAAGDVHPPLFYLLLSGWVRMFGDALHLGAALSLAYGSLADPGACACDSILDPFGDNP